MQIDIASLLAPLQALLLPFFRILAFLQFCPVLENKVFSRRLKVVLALALAVMITPMLPGNVVLTAILSMDTLMLTGEQLLWGMLFGMILHLVFDALHTAGHIISMNMGLGMAVMNDPVNGTTTAIISQFFYAYCALLFFIMDGHLLMVSILYKGFTWWPVGQVVFTPGLVQLVQGLGWMLPAATLMALPAVFVLLIMQFGFGLLNRISPTLNLFSLGFPVSMLTGLVCVAVLVAHISDYYLRLTDDILAMLDALRKQ